MASDPLTPTPSRGARQERISSRTPDAGAIQEARVQRDPGVQASPEDFVAQTGIATAQVGAVAGDLSRVFSEAHARLEERRGAIARARDEGAVIQKVEEELRAFETTGDPTSYAAKMALGARLKTLNNETVGQHEGNALSRDRLAVRLENVYTAATSQAAVISNKAISERTKQVVVGAQSAMVNRILADPSQWETAIAGYDADIENIGGSLGATGITAARATGRVAAVSTLADFYHTAGMPEKATELLAREDIAQLVPDPTALGTLKIKNLAVLAAKKTKEQESLDKIKEQRYMLQNDYLKIQIEMAQLQGKKAGEVAEQGKRMNDLKAQELEIGKRLLELKEAEEGPGLTPSNAGEVMVRYSEGYGFGGLTDRHESRFEGAVTTHMTHGATRDEMGQMVLRPLPPGAVEAIQRRGKWDYTNNMPVWVSQQLGMTEGGQSSTLTGGGQPRQGASAVPSRPAVSPAGGSQESLWKLNNKAIAGPVAAAGRAIEATPGLTSVVPFYKREREEATAKYQTYQTMLSGLIVEAQRNPHFPLGEFKRLESAFNISPGVWDTKGSLFSRLLGADNALAQMEDLMIEKRATKGISQKEKREMSDLIAGLAAFRRGIGVQRYDTAEEVNEARARGELNVGDGFVFNGALKWVAK